MAANHIDIYLGAEHSDRGGQRASGVMHFKPIEVIVHEKYFGVEEFDHDIALLRLPEEVTYSDKIKQIELPEADIVEGSFCTVTGWGATTNSKTEIL